MVVSVGIDVSKDKHDCFIVSSEGEVLADVFTIPNTMDGFAYAVPPPFCIPLNCRRRDRGAAFPCGKVISTPACLICSFSNGR